MYEARPGKLWIGHMGDLRDPALLERTGIKALVHVALEEQLPTLSREMLFCHFPLMDGATPIELVGAAIDLAVSLIRGRVPTMVCCSNGMNRSPCVAAGALSIVERREPDECLRELVRDQPHDIHTGMWERVLTIVSRRAGKS